MPADALTGLAPAKINLFLHVGPPRGDGRHDLDSLVVFAGPEASDRLDVRRADGRSMTVRGPMAETAGPDRDNLVMRAASALAPQAGLHFELEKHLPAAAGLGGGSADAGAALRLVTRLLALDPALARTVAPALGGDVLACLHSVPLMMRGDGERVTRLGAPLPDLPALIVNPGLPCPTGPVFQRFDAVGGRFGLAETVRPDASDAAALTDWLAAETRNDLQGPAITLVPEIETCLAQLSALPGVRLSRMTGSGASCFALFDGLETAQAAGKRLLETHPDWWMRATMLGEGATACSM
ncbi:MAG: 4-(cytidine 5'-diphospho)-2-C-methyl-D-erythritol kinase [Alphaproteobacteria bacterium]|jgi:4-diphosphocytidyl-2-C-methyl-D-erythritol kinase|nr:4-(cytidine 5'-diphospho)-2-C-methyl-D-erythritol kinase [Alphaproteobacteria bacterium]